MPRKISLTLSEDECFACEYFMKTDARKSYPDATRAQLLKNYQKIPKDRRREHEAECKEKWKDE